MDPDIARTARLVEAPNLEGLLGQLEDEGFSVAVEAAHVLPWGRLYDLLEHSDYRASLGTFGIPEIGPDAPILESRGALSNRTFAISLAGWHDGTGRRLAPATLCGAVVRRGDEVALLNRDSWQVLEHISKFHRRGDEERTDIAHRRSWGLIRQAAISANARLDDFLYRSVVLTPEKLQIGLRKAESAGTKVVEVVPSFQGAPASWIDVFDQLRSVPGRYDIPSPEGIVQVLVTPEVSAVLGQIKRWPGRRVAGTRAEAFLANPFATLGEAAYSGY